MKSVCRKNKKGYRQKKLLKSRKRICSRKKIHDWIISRFARKIQYKISLN